MPAASTVHPPDYLDHPGRNVYPYPEREGRSEPRTPGIRHLENEEGRHDMSQATARTGGALCGVLAALVGAVLVAGCRPDQGSPELRSALAWADSSLAATVAAETIPGAVLLVAREGKVVHERAYGAAKLYDFGMQRLATPEPMTIAHRFDLASVTKVMATTFAFMLLVDRGLVEIDQPVHTYLPDFRGPDKDLITVRDLLTHRSGLYRWKPTYYHASTPAEAYAYIRELPLEFPVHEGRHYSDLGLMVAGTVVERVTGRSLAEFLQSDLYAPLGLRHTGFLPRGASPDGPVAATSHGNPYERRMVADDSFGYLCDEDPESFSGWREYTLQAEVNDGNAWYAHGGVAGHAGLFSTARELNTLLQVLLAEGSHEGHPVVDQEVVSTFLAPDTFTGNAVGWASENLAVGDEGPPVRVFSHGGFTGTFVAGVPELGLSIVFLSNRQNVGVDADTQYPDVSRIYRPILERLVRAVPRERSGDAPEPAPRAVRRAEILFTIPEHDFYPENIAFDPVSGDYFLGSMGHSRILRIHADGSYEDFARDLEPLLQSAVGMKVDAARRRLWVCTGRYTLFGGPPEGPAQTGVLLFDLDQGTLVKSWMVEQPTPTHIFNDLTLAANGDVFATTTLFGQIFRVSPDMDEMELVLHTPDSHNNGITMDSEGRYLFFTLDREIRRLELATGEVRQLEVPGDAGVGTDGLYLFEGSLISVKPRLSQVVRLHLTDSLDRVDRVEVLADGEPGFAYPTTGVVAEGSLVLVGTSFADIPRNPEAAEQHPDVLIYRIPLRR